MKKIAFCGTRGLPAKYGGFETVIDELTKRFSDESFTCVVFCRTQDNNQTTGTYKNVELIYVRGSSIRALDTFISSIFTGVYILLNKNEFQQIYWFNNANFPGIILSLLSRLPIAVNTDGLEWRRRKWSFPFKFYYFLSSYLISHIVKYLISDSVSIQEYYEKVFSTKTTFIPYGSNLNQIQFDSDYIEKYMGSNFLETINSGKYFLQITRFEPDNYPLENCLAFIESGLIKSGFKYILVGYNGKTKYSTKIKALEAEGVMILNAIYDEKVLYALRSKCYCYVHGNSVGGTNPALLEAMAVCDRIIAIDNKFSKEVLAKSGIYYQLSNLPQVFLQSLHENSKANEYKEILQNRYQWAEVYKHYRDIFLSENCSNVFKPN